MKKTLAAFLAVLLIAGCSSGQPPAVKYAETPSSKIVLDVAVVNIVDHSNFQPSTSPYNSHNLKPTITEAVHQWLTDHVQAGGNEGQALVVIKDGSLSGETLPMSQDLMDKWFERQQASKYTGHTEVSVEIQGRSGYALASGEATHSITLPETPTETERQNLYATLLNGLMKDFAQNFEGSLREHMDDFIMAGPAPAAR